jgi:heme/copper-type cytochrome/quinol oxidase subunit 2
MGKQRAAHPAATQKPAADKEPEHPALSTSAFAFAFVVLVLAYVLVFLVSALAQNMREDRATHPATTQYPAADQEPQDPAMIFIFAFVFILAVSFIFVLVRLLAVLAHEVREKQAANAGAAQQSARNQDLQDTVLLIASLLALFTELLAFFVATPFTQQAREKQAPRTPTA